MRTSVPRPLAAACIAVSVFAPAAQASTVLSESPTAAVSVAPTGRKPVENYALPVALSVSLASVVSTPVVAKPIQAAPAETDRSGVPSTLLPVMAADAPQYTVLDVLGLPIQTALAIIAGGTTGITLPNSPLIPVPYISIYTVINDAISVARVPLSLALTGQFGEIAPQTVAAWNTFAMSLTEGLPASIRGTLEYDAEVLRGFLGGLTAVGTEEVVGTEEAVGTEKIAATEAPEAEAVDDTELRSDSPREAQPDEDPTDAEADSSSMDAADDSKADDSKADDSKVDDSEADDAAQPDATQPDDAQPEKDTETDTRNADEGSDDGKTE